jgi:hypothetical protein
MKSPNDLTTVNIRKIPVWVVNMYEHQAKQKKQSLEGYLRALLTQMALDNQKACLDRAEILSAQIAKEFGHKLAHIDTTALIREERDAGFL